MMLFIVPPLVVALVATRFFGRSIKLVTAASAGAVQEHSTKKWISLNARCEKGAEAVLTPTRPRDSGAGAGGNDRLRWLVGSGSNKTPVGCRRRESEREVRAHARKNLSLSYESSDSDRESLAVEPPQSRLLNEGSVCSRGLPLDARLKKGLSIVCLPSTKF